MSCAAAPFQVENLQRAAGRIPARPAGRVLGFFDHKLRKVVEEILSLAFSFEPTPDISERTYEVIDQTLSMVIEKLQPRSEIPFYSDALARLKTAKYWILRGYAPSRPPSERELASVKEDQAGRVLEALSKSHP